MGSGAGSAGCQVSGLMRRSRTVASARSSVELDCGWARGRCDRCGKPVRVRREPVAVTGDGRRSIATDLHSDPSSGRHLDDSTSRGVHPRRSASRGQSEGSMAGGSGRLGGRWIRKPEDRPSKRFRPSPGTRGRGRGLDPFFPLFRFPAFSKRALRAASGRPDAVSGSLPWSQGTTRPGGGAVGRASELERGGDLRARAFSRSRGPVELPRGLSANRCGRR